MTPTRIVSSPRTMVLSSFFAACASSVILARGSITTLSAAPGAADARLDLQPHERARPGRG